MNIVNIKSNLLRICRSWNFLSSFPAMALSLFLLSSFQVKARQRDYFSDKVAHLNWEGLDVVYLEDSRFPLYSMGIYFADGALGDGVSKGSTEAALNYMTLGTRRFTQEEIAENLEFFGASLGAEVTHEYSSYQVAGLVKDIVPTVKKMCHLFRDATFPRSNLNKEKRRILSALENSAQNLNFLASRAFREVSMEGTPYAYPVGGKLRDIKRWNSSMLKKRLNYLNDKVKKRIYLTGPRSVLNIKKIITQECGWKGQAQFIRSVKNPLRAVRQKPRLTLVTVKGANQAQVQIGGYLSGKRLGEDELMNLASHFLGSGFTSQLMQVLRVQNGLTYSVGAFAGTQKQYGRAGIMTATNVKTLGKLLEKTRETLGLLSKGEFDKGQFLLSKKALAGSFPFAFESSKALLGELMALDHKGRKYDFLIHYPDRVRGFSGEDVAQKIDQIYAWDKQDIVILGPAYLKKDLEKFGKVRVLPYKKFL